MSLTLYWAPRSSALGSRWILEELGLTYRAVELDLARGDQHEPEYRALNPTGKVPLLVHDGTRVFESAAIAIHLGETFGVARRLYPPPGRQRALALKWLVWCSATLDPAFARWRDQAPVAPDGELGRDPAARELRELLGILDHELGARAYLLGSEFSLVDVHAAGVLLRARAAGVALRRWCALAGWYARCSARPALAASLPEPDAERNTDPSERVPVERLEIEADRRVPSVALDPLAARFRGVVTA